MDNLEAMVKVIEATAWPVVVGGAIHFFKDQLRQLLPKLKLDIGKKTIYFGDVSAQVDAIDKVTEKMEERKAELTEVIKKKEVPSDVLERALMDYDQVILELEAMKTTRKTLIQNVLRQWSPGREEIVETIVEKLGAHRILKMSDETLQSEFNELMLFIISGDPSLPFHMGSLTALYSAGFIDDNNRITQAGLQILRMMAGERVLKPV